MLEFTPFAKHPPGIVLQMLEAAYEAYFEIEPWCREPWLGDWREYDRAVFAEPDTVGACGFVSTLGEKAVGFASWDPRGFPVGVIGHNCVITFDQALICLKSRQISLFFHQVHLLYEL